MQTQILNANTYEQAEQYILDIPKFAGKHTIQDTREILEKLIGDRTSSKVIHIAGTNGKGSVCAYLRAILMQSGCSVGMFTSPHLECIRERICLGEEMISKEDFADTFDKVIRAWKELTKEADEEEKKR